MKASIYIVVEYPHGYEDEYHSIKCVTASHEEACRAAQPDYQYSIEEYVVELY